MPNSNPGFNLSKNCKLIRVKAAVAAGTSAITSDAVNMAGFSTCLFLVPVGTLTSGAVTSIKVQQSSDDGSADAYGDLTDTSVTIADTRSDDVAWVEVSNPEKQYLKCIVSRATQNAVVDGIIAILGGATSVPVTHDATTIIDGELHVSPAEGTA